MSEKGELQPILETEESGGNGALISAEKAAFDAKLVDSEVLPPVRTQEDLKRDILEKSFAKIIEKSKEACPSVSRQQFKIILETSVEFQDMYATYFHGFRNEESFLTLWSQLPETDLSKPDFGLDDVTRPGEVAYFAYRLRGNFDAEKNSMEYELRGLGAKEISWSSKPRGEYSNFRAWKIPKSSKETDSAIVPQLT